MLLVLGIVHKLQQAADPLAGRLVHPAIVAVVALLLLCLVVGLLVRSAVGRHVRRALETILFEKLPGYRLAKAFAGDRPGGGDRPMRPALVSFDDGDCPALVMDELADGRLLVFVPSSPAPMSGAIYLFTPDRVRLLADAEAEVERFKAHAMAAAQREVGLRRAEIEAEVVDRAIARAGELLAARMTAADQGRLVDDYAVELANNRTARA